MRRSATPTIGPWPGPSPRNPTRTRRRRPTATRHRMRTGLDRALVQRRYGRVEPGEFLREISGTGKVASVYNATPCGLESVPAFKNSQHPGPVLNALIAPLTGAMQELYADKL